MIKIVKAFFSGLSKKERQILYIAAGFIVLALFDRMIIGPISKESKHLDEKIESQIKLTKKNIRILEYKDRILDDDEAYGDYYVSEDATQEELIASFLSEIEQMAKLTGITLTNINPVSTEEKNDYMLFQLTIECSGNMRNMLDFFYSISTAKKPIRLSSIELSAKKRETYEAKCIVTVEKLIISKAEEYPKRLEKKKTLNIKEKLTFKAKEPVDSSVATAAKEESIEEDTAE
jgi:Tfp pilus assembly protein PilO